MVDFQFVEEDVPIPGLLQTEFIQRAKELVDDPLFHELFERGGALVGARQVIHADASQDREHVPVPPKPFIDQILRVVWIVLHYQREYRGADLSVAGFIGLDAGDHFFEVIIASLMRQRSQTHKLEVGEAGFENHVGGDVKFDRILSEREFVEKMPCCDCEPVVGVVRLMRSIEL